MLIMQFIFELTKSQPNERVVLVVSGAAKVLVGDIIERGCISHCNFFQSQRAI
jgi:hypothetical protein